jgi:acyl-CoA hydrolase
LLHFTESKSGGFLLGGELGGRFNHGAKWITHHAGIFPVGVVNAPQLIARLQSRVRAHGGSST